MRVSSIVASLILLLLLDIRSARAQDAQPGQTQAAPNNDALAREEFRRGQQLYDQGDFAAAADAFDHAFSLSQRPQLLYNIFISRRDAGQLGPAITALRSYLDLVPNVPDAERLRQRLTSMERLYAQQTQTEEQAAEARRQAEEAERRAREATEQARNQEATAQTTSSETSGARSSTRSVRPRSRSIVPWIVGGAGVAVIAGGVITGVLANGKKSELEEYCSGGDSSGCPPGYEDIRDSGQVLAAVTDVLLVAGVGALATGAVLYFVLDGSSEEETTRPTATFGCTTDGCIGSASVRF